MGYQHASPNFKVVQVGTPSTSGRTSLSVMDITTTVVVTANTPTKRRDPNKTKRLCFLHVCLVLEREKKREMKGKRSHTRSWAGCHRQLLHSQFFPLLSLSGKVALAPTTTAGNKKIQKTRHTRCFHAFIYQKLPFLDNNGFLL